MVSRSKHENSTRCRPPSLKSLSQLQILLESWPLRFRDGSLMQFIINKSIRCLTSTHAYELCWIDARVESRPAYRISCVITKLQSSMHSANEIMTLYEANVMKISRGTSTAWKWFFALPNRVLLQASWCDASLTCKCEFPWVGLQLLEWTPVLWSPLARGIPTRVVQNVSIAAHRSFDSWSNSEGPLQIWACLDENLNCKSPS